MTLFRFGDFTLQSGEQSRWKIDCDDLTDEDITALAYLIATRKKPFASVSGIPTGGTRLATELGKYSSPDGTYHLVVDDVYTTGASMDEYAENYTGDLPLHGVVVFSRSVSVANWVDILFWLSDPYEEMYSE